MHNLIAAFIFSALFAQVRPDGEALMKRMAESAGKRQSMEYAMDVTVTATQGGQDIPSQAASGRFTVAFENPAKLRIEEQVKFGTSSSQSLLVSDGEFTWTFNPAAKQYTKKSVGQRLTVLALPSNLSLGLPVTDIQGSPKILREETLELDGQTHNCWVVFDVLRVPESRAAQISNGVMTSWIDKEEWIGLKHEASLSITPTAPPGVPTPPSLDLKVVMMMKSLKVNETIPGEKFTFTPPTDAKEVEVLSASAQPDRTGKAAPPFEAKDLVGKSYTLDSLRGKPLFLDFWTTWCKPCQESAPALERIATDFRDKGLTMLAIDVGEDRRVVEEYLKSKPMSYPVILGSEFGMEAAFQVNAFPTFILIDPGGKIAAQQIGWGSDSEATVRSMLARMGLGSPASGPDGTTSKPLAPVVVNTPAAPAPVQYKPGAVAVDHSRSLYIADFGRARVIRVTSGGPSVVVAGTGSLGSRGDQVPAIFASLEEPAAIAVDTSGNLYIAEAGRGRVRKVDPSGTISTLEGGTQLQRVGGIAADTSGNVYVSETSAHRVRKITPDGRSINIAGTGAPGSRGDGGPATAAQLAAPTGLAIDASGNLYIADTGNHRVRKVTPDGVIVLVAGNGSSGASGDGGLAVLAQLKGPTGLAVDAMGNLYISDPADSRIRKVGPNRTITTFAGTGEPGLAGDGGRAIRAQFSGVASLAIDQDGNLYLADIGNGRIRRISSDGVITTVPGTAADDER